MIKEIDLYKPLLEGAVASGWALWRVEDGSFGRKPGDCTGVAPDGRGVLLEVKSLPYRLSKDRPFPLGIFRFQQLEWLRRYADLGGLALAAIYDNVNNEMRLYNLDNWALVDLKRPVSEYTSIELTKDDKGRYVGWQKLLNG